MDPAGLAQRYHKVKDALPQGVLLVAVSKKRTVEEIKALYDLGHRDFGENYPQELRDKQPQLPEDIRWHFIGHLQSNKVKYLAPFVHLVHGADSRALLDELDKRAAQLGAPSTCSCKSTLPREETKHGFSRRILRPCWWKRPWNAGKISGFVA
jgi:uncharacterized pyridoxal phosphate-containing UPF0001 family protein